MPSTQKSKSKSKPKSKSIKKEKHIELTLRRQKSVLSYIDDFFISCVPYTFIKSLVNIKTTRDLTNLIIKNAGYKPDKIVKIKTNVYDLEKLGFHQILYNLVIKTPIEINGKYYLDVNKMIKEIKDGKHQKETNQIIKIIESLQ